MDGAWWPASRDLLAELPALAEAVYGQAGRLERVGFGRSDWDVVPNRTRGWVNGRRIGLDGFATFAPDLVWVATSRTGSAPLFLQVVPPDTPPERAAELLRRAGTDEPGRARGDDVRPHACSAGDPRAADGGAA